MKSLEESCREASKVFAALAEKSVKHHNKEVLYGLSLDCYASAAWIENMRKFEFMFAQMYPECYKDVWRAVNDTVVSIDDHSIYPQVLKFTSFTLTEESDG